MVLDILNRIVPDDEVRVFGSRRNGPHKPWSDLDIAIVGKTGLETAQHDALIEAFQASDLPYRVDVLDWHAIPQRFRENILRTGYDVFKEASAL